MEPKSPKLVRWETPFTEVERPSVGLLLKTKLDGTDLLSAIVAPEGVDKYPKFLVYFGEIVAFTCFEEAYSPRRDFDEATTEDYNLCAYQYLHSPWLESYEGWQPFFSAGKVESFSHYLILGGDNNIEIITPNVPKIEKVDEKRTLKFEIEI
jgi:hypothetical protein